MESLNGFERKCNITFLNYGINAFFIPILCVPKPLKKWQLEFEGF